LGERVDDALPRVRALLRGGAGRDDADARGGLAVAHRGGAVDAEPEIELARAVGRAVEIARAAVVERDLVAARGRRLERIHTGGERTGGGTRASGGRETTGEKY